MLGVSGHRTTIYIVCTIVQARTLPEGVFRTWCTSHTSSSSENVEMERILGVSEVTPCTSWALNKNNHYLTNKRESVFTSVN